MPGFLRQCPSCGRRFKISETRSTIGKERESYVTTRAGAGSGTASSFFAQRFGWGNVRTPAQATWNEHASPDEKVRVTRLRKKIQHTYKCEHCGHTWKEERVEETEPKIELQRV